MSSDIRNREEARERAIALLREKATDECGWLSDFDIPSIINTVELDPDTRTVSLYDATGDIDLEAVVDYVFQAIDEELDYLMNELETRIRMLKDITKRLNDKLHAHAFAAPMPKLPDKPGYYLTQQHMLLLRDVNGDWSVREFGERPIRGFWEEGSLDCYEKDPKVIYAALGPEAFPLVPLSEVILPSEHIEEED